MSQNLDVPAEPTDPTYLPVVVVDFVPEQPRIEDPRFPGLIYGFPDDGFPDKNGALELLKVASTLEDAGIQCCMTGTSALIFFGAGRIRGDWQICVPTEKLDSATALLQSALFTDHYTLSQVLPFIGIGSLLHTFPRFKCRGLRLWFQIIPSEDCHIECKSSNFEHSNLGLPYPRLEVYAQSLLDTCNRVDICDLVDGMNLSREWGEEHLDLTGTNDVDWMEKKNERILKSVPDNENSCLCLLYGEESRKELWEKTTRLKEHRLGWKYPKEHYATRFRLHIDPDPRYTLDRYA